MSHARVINLLNLFADEGETTAASLDRLSARGGISREIATRAAAETRELARQYRAAAQALTSDTTEDGR